MGASLGDGLLGVPKGDHGWCSPEASAATGPPRAVVERRDVLDPRSATRNVDAKRRGRGETVMDAKTLEDFLAKQEITETLMLHFRGVDRLDRELTVGSFHPGAVIDYGRLFKGDAEQMADWIWANHSHMRFSCHLATNVVVEVDGDRGFSECYMFTALRMDQGTPDPGVRHADASSAEAKQKLSDVF